MGKYYLENKQRGTVGNSIQWWKYNDNGYTCDIRAARKFEADEVIKYLDSEKFTPHKCEDVDRIIQHHIDIQDLRSKSKKPHTLDFPMSAEDYYYQSLRGIGE